MKNFNDNVLVKSVALFTLIMFFCSVSPNPAFAKDITTKIGHKPFKYFVPGKRIKLNVNVQDKTGVNVARCYFKASNQADYVFVEMSHTGIIYEAVLPAPDKSAPSIDYLFLVVNGKNQIVRTKVFSMEKDEDEKVPEWQKISAEGQIKVGTELSKAPSTVGGFTDSITMDVVESAARFGYVAGLYGAAQMAEAGGTTGTAATATSVGIVSASSGGISTLGWIGIGALALGGGAGAAAAASGGGGGGGDNDNDGGGSVTQETLVGSWKVTEQSETYSDWHMSCSLSSSHSCNCTEYSSVYGTHSWSGSWSYNQSSRYFKLSPSSGGNMDGTISGSANDFYVDGHWSTGSSGRFHWVRQ